MRAEKEHLVESGERETARSPLVLIGFAIGLVAASAGQVARAAIPDASGLIHGCYTASEGDVRIVDPNGPACRRHERSIQWNQTGPQGAPGVQGPAGPAGLSHAVQTDNASPSFTAVEVSGDVAQPTAVLAWALPPGNYTLQANVSVYAQFPFGTLTPFVHVVCSFAVGAGKIGGDFVSTVGGALNTYATLPLLGSITLAGSDTVKVLCHAEGVGTTSNGVIGVSTQPSVGIATQIDLLTKP
jgi:hypothetical protein